MKQTAPPNYPRNALEIAAWNDQSAVVGVDEVGRGCLAGPVVASAVILPINAPSALLDTIKDSKLMSEKQRKITYEWIVAHCRHHTAIVHARGVDRHNVYQATILGMKRALCGLLSQATTHPQAILVDAMPLTLSDTAYDHIVVHSAPKGESWSSSIAAASIVAKVTRDAIMKRYEALFPAYSFGRHKGYGTAVHQNAIATHGHSIIHRLTFCAGKSDKTRTQRHENQQTLC